MSFLLDTSFLLSAIEFRIDVTGELTAFGAPVLATTASVVKELGKLSSGSGKRAGFAKRALELLERVEAEIIATRGRKADDDLVAEASKGKATVCTVDRELKERLRASGVDVITIRQRKRLVRWS